MGKHRLSNRLEIKKSKAAYSLSKMDACTKDCKIDKGKWYKK